MGLLRVEPMPRGGRKARDGLIIERSSVTALVLGVILVVSSMILFAGLQLSPPVSAPRNSTPGGGTLDSPSTFSFGAAGDYGVPPNTTAIALAERAKNASLNFLLALGDLGYTSSEQAFCDMLKSHFNDVVVITGNHDTGENGPGDIGLTAKYCPFTLGVNVTAAPNSPGYGFSYYFDYPANHPLARFVMIAPGVIRGSTYLNWAFSYWRNGSYDGGLARYDTNFSLSHPIYYDWTRDVVNDARAKGIPWVIAGMHKMCITVGEKVACDPLSGTGQEIFDELVRLKVDLILQAHDHNYQRSKQIALNANCETVASGGNFNSACVAADGKNGTYTAGVGTVIVVQGTGGKDMDLVTINGNDKEIGYFDSVMSSNANTQGTSYWGEGFVKYTVTNNSISEVTNFCTPGLTNSSGECPSIAGKVFHDAFVITRKSGPVADFVYSPRWPQVNQTVTFNASGSSDPGNPNPGLQYRWDWNGDGSWDTGWSASPDAAHAFASKGSYTVLLEVQDSLGANGTISATVVADSEPPATRASLSGTTGSNGWYRSAVTVTLTAVDDLSGVASTWYRVDGGSWKRYAASFVVSSDGNHFVNYNSTDNAGNVESPATVSFKNDGTPPVTSYSLQGVQDPNGTFLSPINVTLTPFDATSGVASTIYRIDTGSFTTYTSPFVISNTGAHSVAFHSTDVAGNDEMQRFLQFMNGTVRESYPPVAAASFAGVLGPSGWYNSTVTVTLTIVNGSAPSEAIKYRLDRGTWQTYGQPFLVVGDNNHTLEYYATDNQGYNQTIQVASLKIDTTPPNSIAGVAGTKGTNGWYVTLVTITLSATDSMSGVASTFYRLDGEATQYYSVAVSLDDGAHNFSYYSVDLAGNKEGAHSILLNVESSNPYLEVHAPASPVTTQSVRISWTGVDTLSGIARYELSVDGSAWRSVAMNTSATLSLGDGPHTVALKAVSVAGTETVSSVTVTVDTNPFNLYRPYAGVPLYLLIMIILASLVCLLLLYSRSRRKREDSGDDSLPSEDPSDLEEEF